jgi:hypothetical protein
VLFLSLALAVASSLRGGEKTGAPVTSWEKQVVFRPTDGSTCLGMSHHRPGPWFLYAAAARLSCRIILRDKDHGLTGRVSQHNVQLKANPERAKKFAPCWGNSSD